MNIHIKLLTKSGCTLCSRPIFILKRLKNLYPIRVTMHNIDNAQEYRQFINKVPVVLVNDVVVCETRIVESVIREQIELLMNQ